MLIPYNPFKWLADAVNPKANIYEEKGKLIAEFEMPGLRAEDIDVEVEENQIKVKAQRKENKEIKDKGYYRQEITSSSWQRIIPLPKKVDEKTAKASYENGVLKITSRLAKLN